MTDNEAKLLSATADQVARLFSERDDLIVGITTAFLDLYRAIFAARLDTKDAVLARLHAQLDDMRRLASSDHGGRYLRSLIESLETDRLDAAKLLREPPVGSA
jgi:hypothetical protein